MSLKNFDYKKLGAILKESREKAGYTQRDIADYFNVKYQTVSAWENGKNKIDIETLFKMCLRYNVEFSRLLEVVSGEKKSEGNTTIELSEKEGKVVEGYRAKPDMQPAVDKLLDVCEENNSTGDKSGTGLNLSPSRQDAEFAEEADITCLRFYEDPSAAGYGVEASEEYEMVNFEHVPAGTDYATRIVGHSMEPTFHEGDIVFVARCEEPRLNKPHIFTHNNMNLCKHFRQEGQRVWLESDNEEYEDIVIKEGDVTHCRGLIIGKAHM